MYEASWSKLAVIPCFIIYITKTSLKASSPKKKNRKISQKNIKTNSLESDYILFRQTKRRILVFEYLIILHFYVLFLWYMSIGNIIQFFNGIWFINLNPWNVFVLYIVECIFRHGLMNFEKKTHEQ